VICFNNISETVQDNDIVAMED